MSDYDTEFYARTQAVREWLNHSPLSVIAERAGISRFNLVRYADGWQLDPLWGPHRQGLQVLEDLRAEIEHEVDDFALVLCEPGASE